MGLAANVVLPTANLAVVDVIAIHIPLQRVCTDGSSSSTFEHVGSFDTTIYRIFSMQDDMKTLQMPVRVKNEFELFLQYAEAKTLGAIDPWFDSLDTFLGQIGITTLCEG